MGRETTQRQARAEFRIRSDYSACGDQPQAIEGLLAGLRDGARHQTLLGVTGSGKTFTMAKVIEAAQRPTLVLAPNKTLAAQLYAEFRELFPENAVEYFVSYYDYYQPEAYVPSTDTYIEKDASINDRLERLRNSATRSLLDRRDVVLVASVSCIYGLGSPEAYAQMSLPLRVGQTFDRDELLRALTAIQYSRNNLDFRRGSFRARGDVIEVFPAYEEARVVRLELWGDEIEAIAEIDPLRGEVLADRQEITIYPSGHYVTPKDRLQRALETIREELEVQLARLRQEGKLLERQRLEQRTRFDLEMIQEIGTCPGIENYSRHLDGRAPGQAPYTLINYFPENLLVFLDESHVTVPQIGGMYKGDRARKQNLVEHGFRLPSALDNRPLRFEEWEQLVRQVIHVSATPSKYELEMSAGRVVQQIVRPTGLVDPQIEVRPARSQVDDLLEQARAVVEGQERVLVTTLTKRMAEELTEYLRDAGLKAKYMHADIDAIERMNLLRDLRLGVFDVLVGINLLREGLDLPEVALVAVLDADKEGFLRSTSSLIQTCGRAARNVHGRVILYADRVTDSMARAIDETERRRAVQEAYNREHDITPRTIVKGIRDGLQEVLAMDYADAEIADEVRSELEKIAGKDLDPEKLRKHVRKLRSEMAAAAEKLDFEKAAKLRDEIFRLEKLELELP
ncbi:MAG: excinuclease ABC subunit UvrB [Planctomycetes bacterium]|nr:excinuclease ABC subunit UvrB [Planctomycetota bacterium]